MKEHSAPLSGFRVNYNTISGPTICMSSIGVFDNDTRRFDAQDFIEAEMVFLTVFLFC